LSNFIASITDIQRVHNLTLVTFNSFSEVLSMVGLELNPNLEVGSEVHLSVKATAVAIAKNFTGELSFTNQIEMSIQKIEEGQLLSSLILTKNELTIESIITSKSLKRMNLLQGEKVTVLIKSSDLSIVEKN